MKTQINNKLKYYLTVGLILILGSGLAAESFASPNNRRIANEEVEEQIELTNLLKEYEFEVIEEVNSPKLYKVFDQNDNLILECLISNDDFCENERLTKLLRISDLLMEVGTTLYYKTNN